MVEIAKKETQIFRFGINHFDLWVVANLGTTQRWDWNINKKYQNSQKWILLCWHNSLRRTFNTSNFLNTLWHFRNIVGQLVAQFGNLKQRKNTISRLGKLKFLWSICRFIILPLTSTQTSINKDSCSNICKAARRFWSEQLYLKVVSTSFLDRSGIGQS